MTIFVVGGAGYIGSHMVHELLVELQRTFVPNCLLKNQF